MKVFPAINCDDKKCFSSKLSLSKSFLPKKAWVHVDVSDRTFARKKSFFDSGLIENYSKGLNFECHLMMDWERAINGPWLKSKCKRFLIHSSRIKDWNLLHEISKKFKKEIGIAVGFDGDVKDMHFPKWIKFVEVLAVKPGMSGQKFQKRALKIMSFLKKNFPNVKISVDGGVDLKVGKLAKKNGADILISSSYIWNSNNYKKSYKNLSSI